MSKDVLSDVVKLSYTYQIFPLEDVYVAMIIRDLRDVKVKDNRKHFSMSYGAIGVGCLMNNLFVQHDVFPQLSNYYQASRESLKILHICKNLK